MSEKPMGELNHLRSLKIPAGKGDHPAPLKPPQTPERDHLKKSGNNPVTPEDQKTIDRLFHPDGRPKGKSTSSPEL